MDLKVHLRTNIGEHISIMVGSRNKTIDQLGHQLPCMRAEYLQLQQLCGQRSDKNYVEEAGLSKQKALFPA